jgi:hypothetical protein
MKFSFGMLILLVGLLAAFFLYDPDFPINVNIIP